MGYWDAERQEWVRGPEPAQPPERPSGTGPSPWPVTVCPDCGRPDGWTGSYCTDCDSPTADAPQLGPDPALRHMAAGAGLTGAVCMVVAISMTHRYVGVRALPVTLHDNAGTLAYNIAFIVVLAAGSLLALATPTARLGLGMCMGAGMVYPMLLIGDIATMLFRSGPPRTSGYVGPAAGTYWCIASAVLAGIAAIPASTALHQSGDLQTGARKTRVLWAALSSLCGTVWLIGTSLPWKQYAVTLLNTTGTPKAQLLDPCCALSEQPGQWVVQSVVFTVLVVGTGLIAASIRSDATASGLLLAVCGLCAAQPISRLFTEPRPLAELASALHITESQLRTQDPVVALHVLPGNWTAVAAAAGLLLIAVARGFLGRHARS